MIWKTLILELRFQLIKIPSRSSIEIFNIHLKNRIFGIVNRLIYLFHMMSMCSPTSSLVLECWWFCISRCASSCDASSHLDQTFLTFWVNSGNHKHRKVMEPDCLVKLWFSQSLEKAWIYYLVVIGIHSWWLCLRSYTPIF